ncbi:MAG: trigger factor, partial [Selenomonadales bacterium]|nr:trigger factor [Selenomonadales bacterium]
AAFSAALKEADVEPVTRPEVEAVTFEAGQDAVFKVTFTAKPEVTLGEYKGLKVAKEVAAVTDEDVQKQIDAVLGRKAKMVAAEEDAEVANGDFAVIDFKGFVDDVAFPGGEGKGYPLEIGSGSFIPGFEEQLIGAKKGAEVDVKVTFPTEYHAADLAGKEALFKVTVQDIKRKELPTLDDAFAKEEGKFDTVEEWKADIRTRLEQTAAAQAEKAWQANAIKACMDNTQVDVPEVMVEERINYMVQDMAVNLEAQGLKLDQYLAYMKMDMDALRANFKDSAEINVKTDLMLEKIAQVENLEVKQQDMAMEIGAMAETYGAAPEEVSKIIRDQGRVADLAKTVLRKKAAVLVVENAVIAE